MIAALVLCNNLTELSLACGFNSAHWSALLATLTRIKQLKIRLGRLATLECFASGPIRRSLDHLSLEDLDPSMSPSELSHLYGLRRLRTLHISNSFSPLLEDAMIDSLLSPPSPHLPALTSVRYRRTLSYRSELWATVERTGPSYEWMQSRLTQ